MRSFRTCLALFGWQVCHHYDADQGRHYQKQHCERSLVLAKALLEVLQMLACTRQRGVSLRYFVSYSQNLLVLLLKVDDCLVCDGVCLVNFAKSSEERLLALVLQVKAMISQYLCFLVDSTSVLKLADAVSAQALIEGQQPNRVSFEFKFQPFCLHFVRFHLLLELRVLASVLLLLVPGYLVDLALEVVHNFFHLRQVLLDLFQEVGSVSVIPSAGR